MRTPIVVRLVPPVDLAESLEPFRRNGDDLLDRWDGARLLRTTRLGGRIVAWRGEPGGSIAAPTLAVATDVPLTTAEQRDLADAVRATFAAAQPGWPDLLRHDPVLAALHERHPGLRPVLQPDLFTALIRSISAQQVNLAWAATTRRRLAALFGDPHGVGGDEVYRLDPRRIAGAPPEDIRALQFSTSKARSIIAVAQAFADGTVDPDRVAGQADDEVIATLVSLRGIGVWSAEWILARTYGRPRVVAGDLGVRKAVARAYLGRDIASEAEVRAATAHWGRHATLAQALLLRTLVP
jgi:3-methyladenine DNA glycosylase/8-oxoguanine DNA glycosylase